MTCRSIVEDDIHVDLPHPENSNILEYLRFVNEYDYPAFLKKEKEDRWYVFWREYKPDKRYGSHPDCFAWLFERVARGLTGGGYRIVYGRDCLVHSESGLLLGFCQGMCYALRLSDETLAPALAAIKANHKDLHPANRPNAMAWNETVRAIGPAWVPGTFNDDEEHWFRGV